MAPLRELREAIWLLSLARLAGERLPPESVARLNASAAAPPPRPKLQASGTAVVTKPDAAAALSALARDAIDLFGGPLGSRIHQCAAEDCQLLFVDASHGARRRWCSMERCGNRAKVRAHRRQTH